jgi:K+-transporting ATPase ATPase B chain
MDRLVRFNVLAMSGPAVEAAGDVVRCSSTRPAITLGNRQASEFIPLPDVTEKELADAAQLASLSWDAGRPLHRGSGQGALRHQGRDLAQFRGHHFIPFSAHAQARPRPSICRSLQRP